MSPREAGFRRSTDPSQVLAQVRAAYEAFAYCPLAEDPPDHVALEAGFLGWLCLKQAYALANGQQESFEIAVEAADGFVRGHLAALAEPLATRLADAGPEYLRLAARALHERVGDRPADLEGDWVPGGLDGSGCSTACGAAAGEEEPDDITGTILAGLPSEPLAS